MTNLCKNLVPMITGCLLVATFTISGELCADSVLHHYPGSIFAGINDEEWDYISYGSEGKIYNNSSTEVVTVVATLPKVREDAYQVAVWINVYDGHSSENIVCDIDSCDDDGLVCDAFDGDNSTSTGTDTLLLTMTSDIVTTTSWEIRCKLPAEDVTASRIYSLYLNEIY